MNRRLLFWSASQATPWAETPNESAPPLLVGVASDALAGPGGGELAPRLHEVLGNDAHVGENGHEVRVAAPARHDMHVPVIDDPGSGGASEVPAEVVAIRGVFGAKRFESLRGEPMQLEGLGVVEPVEVDAVTVGRNEEVPGRVRVLVEHHEGALAAMDDEVLLVVTLCGGAEDAAFDLVRDLDVLEPPGRPESLHHSQRL